MALDESDSGIHAAASRMDTQLVRNLAIAAGFA